MTTFETSQNFELADALEAIRLLDAEAEELCRVDMMTNPAYALAKLEQIDSRKRHIRLSVRNAMK